MRPDIGLIRKQNIVRRISVVEDVKVHYAVYKKKANESLYWGTNVNNAVNVLINESPTEVNRFYFSKGLLHHTNFSYDDAKSLRLVDESVSIRGLELGVLADLFKLGRNPKTSAT